MNGKRENYWKEFSEWGNFAPDVLEKFEKYYELLVDWNEKFNLTAITNLKSVINLFIFSNSLYKGLYSNIIIICKII